MIKKTCEKGFRLFNYIILMFPIAMALFLGLIYMHGGWGDIIDGHTLDYYFLGKIEFSFFLVLLNVIWGAIALCVGVAIYRISETIDNKLIKTIFISIFIGIISFGIRCMLLLVFAEDLLPFSDFAVAWERARGNFEGGNISYYSLFPAYLNWSVFESKVIQLFGEHYIVILCINAFFSGITTSLIYLIAKEIRLDEFMCICAGILYAFYPSNILYNTVGTPEFLAIVLNTLGVFLLVKTFNTDGLFNKYVLSIIGGVSLGVGGSYKTFSIVMIVAFFIISTMDFLMKTIKNKKSFLSFFVPTFLIIISFMFTTNIILAGTSDIYNMELDTKTATPHYLLIGLNTESEGQIHVGTLSRQYYQYYLENEMNYDTAREYAYNLLKEDWNNNRTNIIPNFAKKMIWAWQDDCTPVRYFLNSEGINPDSTLEIIIYKVISSYGYGVSEIMYMLILFLALLGTFYYAKKRELEFGYEYIALVIFGYFCMIFLSEGQSRYKCLIMAYVCIISSVGISFCKDSAKKFIRIVK